MANPRRELFYAIRWRYVARYLGQFCLIIGTLNLLNLLVALFYSEYRIAISYAALVAGLFCVGGVLSRIRTHGRMQMNEAMVIAAAVFLVVPLAAAVPLTTHGMAFLDAWFETVSAATTTGLSTQASVVGIPKTFLFARAWMQWYGGLGIVILSLALIVRPGMTALRLASLDAPDDLVGGTRAHARRVLNVYLLLSGVGLLGWLLLGGPPMTGLLYILSAVSTGGFAPTDNSFADLSGVQLAWLVTLVTLAGALPLALYHRAWKDGWRQLLQNLESRALLVAGLAMSGLLGLILWSQGMVLSEAAVHAPLMALSAQTTSGFSSLAPGDLDAGSKGVLILAMAMGGSVGSTAGGFKLLRLLILFGLLYRSLMAMSMPANAVITQRLGKRQIEAKEVEDALMIILIFCGVVVLSWLPFLLYGYAPLDALFEVVSATGTVGLSAGVTAAGMPAVLKLILCADMLLGRLEFVAWMVFFYHRTWFGRKRGKT
ncbi:MAG: potassium transporter TrkG [Desulfuromonadales bacterium]